MSNHKILFNLDQELLDLYGIKSRNRIIDTMTMIFKDNNEDINVNLAFIKELMDEETINNNEALLLVHQVTKVYGDLDQMVSLVTEYSKN